MGHVGADEVLIVILLTLYFDFSSKYIYEILKRKSSPELFKKLKITSFSFRHHLSNLSIEKMCLVS
jgi:hypothetical protein